MKITARKITTLEDMRLACESTIDAKSSMTLDKIYKCMHSPARTQLFWIQMEGIPTFCSVHLVRHKVWTEHFVKSNREDRGGAGNDEVTRNTPINHGMFLNAEALVNMAHKRLCYQASKETREIMVSIREAIKLVDPDLSKYMVPQCFARNMYCPELRTCGNFRVKTNLNDLYDEYDFHLFKQGDK